MITGVMFTVAVHWMMLHESISCSREQQPVNHLIFSTSLMSACSRLALVTNFIPSFLHYLPVLSYILHNNLHALISCILSLVSHCCMLVCLVRKQHIGCKTNLYIDIGIHNLYCLRYNTETISL